ncbi:MAG: hypothetical protein ACRDKX_00400 [Solirubrobacterales bacterium]
MGRPAAIVDPGALDESESDAQAQLFGPTAVALQAAGVCAQLLGQLLGLEPDEIQAARGEPSEPQPLASHGVRVISQSPMEILAQLFALQQQAFEDVAALTARIVKRDA